MVGDQRRVGDKVIPTACAHEPGEYMEAHAGFDGEVGIAAQARYRVAAGPRRREADADSIAAMMAPVMR